MEMRLRGTDIRAERQRTNPPVSQVELAQALGLQQVDISRVEMEHFELSQEEYQRWLATVRKLIAEREKGAQ